MQPIASTDVPSSSILPEEGDAKAIQDRLISKRAAAGILSVSCRTLDRWVGLGRIEKVYLGSTVRIRLSDVQRIVQEGCV